ncbi:MAG: prefoldin subunit alpha [Desulfurococcales archaeon]|nr:prefoldin subunit alpha [Desulfurococcales archaeon]
MAQVDPRALIAQVQAIEAQINKLQGILAELTATRDNIHRSKQSIEAIASTEEPVLAPLDPNMNAIALVEAKDRDRFLVHLGMGIYARLPREKALKILEEKEERVSRSISEATKQLKDLTSLYEQYQALLQQLALAQQAQARQGSQ